MYSLFKFEDVGDIIDSTGVEAVGTEELFAAVVTFVIFEVCDGVGNLESPESSRNPISGSIIICAPFCEVENNT